MVTEIVMDLPLLVAQHTRCGFVVVDVAPVSLIQLHGDETVKQSAAIAAACGSDDDNGSSGGGEKGGPDIKIGASLPLTGEFRPSAVLGPISVDPT